MIYSMTGFASKIIFLQQEENKIKLTISIKSLNSRYLDISTKLPYILTQYENELIKLIKKKLQRGSITLLIHLDDPNAFKTSIKPSIEILKGYVNAAQMIQKELNIPGSLTISEFIRLPNIFTLEDKGVDENSKKIIIDSIANVIDEVVQERLKEGIELQNDLKQRTTVMNKKIDQIIESFNNSINTEKEKISKKIQEIKELVSDQSSESYIQMLQLGLDKIDIHEELSRFKAHLQKIENILKSAEIENGKQLDFTLQELFREINTILSKSINSQIIDLAIGIKVEIEKAREQAQNIL